MPFPLLSLSITLSLSLMASSSLSVGLYLADHSFPRALALSSAFSLAVENADDCDEPLLSAEVRFDILVALCWLSTTHMRGRTSS